MKKRNTTRRRQTPRRAKQLDLASLSSVVSFSGNNMVAPYLAPYLAPSVPIVSLPNVPKFGVPSLNRNMASEMDSYIYSELRAYGLSNDATRRIETFYNDNHSDNRELQNMQKIYENHDIRIKKLLDEQQMYPPSMIRSPYYKIEDHILRAAGAAGGLLFPSSEGMIFAISRGDPGFEETLEATRQCEIVQEYMNTVLMLKREMETQAAKSGKGGWYDNMCTDHNPCDPFSYEFVEFMLQKSFGVPAAREINQNLKNKFDEFTTMHEHFKLKANILIYKNVQNIPDNAEAWQELDDKIDEWGWLTKASGALIAFIAAAGSHPGLAAGVENLIVHLGRAGITVTNDLRVRVINPAGRTLIKSFADFLKFLYNYSSSNDTHRIESEKQPSSTFIKEIQDENKKIAMDMIDDLPQKIQVDLEAAVRESQEFDYPVGKKCPSGSTRSKKNKKNCVRRSKFPIPSNPWEDEFEYAIGQRCPKGSKRSRKNKNICVKTNK